MNINDDRKELIKHLAVGLFTFLLFGTLTVVTLFDIVDEFTTGEKVRYGAIGIALSLIGLIYSAVTMHTFYTKYIKPVKAPDSPRSDRDINRERNINKRLPGKDIYEVLNGVRMSHVVLAYIAVAVAMVLVAIAIIIKVTGEVGLDIRISIGLAALCIITALVIAGKKDFSFVTVKDFRLKVEEAGIDPVRLNNDFMMASHFNTIRGIVFLGRDYLVLFIKDLCDVVRTDDITQVVCTRQTDKINGSNMIFYFIKVVLKNGKWYRFRMSDQKETELLCEKLRLLNIVAVNNDILE